jgi:hypothetical protein
VGVGRLSHQGSVTVSAAARQSAHQDNDTPCIRVCCHCTEGGLAHLHVLYSTHAFNSSAPRLLLVLQVQRLQEAQERLINHLNKPAGDRPSSCIPPGTAVALLLCPLRHGHGSSWHLSFQAGHVLCHQLLPPKETLNMKECHTV